MKTVTPAKTDTQPTVARGRLTDRKGFQITMLVMTVVVAIWLVFCLVVQSLTIHKTFLFFNQTYDTFRNFLAEHNDQLVASEVLTQEDDGVSIDYQYEYTIKWVNEYNFGYPVFSCKITSTTDHILLTSEPLYGLRYGNQITYQIFSPEDDLLPTSQIIAIYDRQGKIKNIKLIVIDGVTVTDPTTASEVIDEMNQIYASTDILFNNFLQSAGLSISYQTAISDISEQCYQLAMLKVITFVGLLVAVAAIFPLVVYDLKLLIRVIQRRHPQKLVPPTPVTTPAPTDAPLPSLIQTPRRRGFPLFFNERLLCILALLALFCGSCTLVISLNGQLYQLLHSDNDLLKSILFDTFYLYPLPTNITLFLNALLPFLQLCTPIAIIILFFLKIDNMTSHHKIWQALLTYFYVGFLIYFVELLLLDKLRLIENIYTAMPFQLPGNMFLGMVGYTLFAAFLLYTPAWATRHPKRLVWWRCLAILPLTYLLVGALVIPNVRVSSFISVAFYSSSTAAMSTFFVILYVFMLFLLQHRQRRRQATIIVDTTKKSYAVTKNLLAIGALCLAFILEAIYNFATTGTFILETMWIPLAAAPFMLFYRSRPTPRNWFGNLLYGLAYTIAYLASYIIITIIFITNPDNADLANLLGDVIAIVFKQILLA